MSESQLINFDTAEPLDAPSSGCGFCGQQLQGSYFTLNGRVMCQSCHARVSQHLAEGGAGGAARFATAAAFGLGLGLLGTLAWYLVEHLFSLRIGLVAVLVGYLAGTGVFRGSGRRGGRAYQVLAAVLTYACICFTAVPTLARLAQEAPRNEESAAVDEAPAAVDGQSPPTAQSALPPAQSTVPTAAAWLFAVAYSLTLPFRGWLDALGLLIAAFGVWEAWRRNRQVPLQLEGPFTLAAPAAAAPGASEPSAPSPSAT